MELGLKLLDGVILELPCRRLAPTLSDDTLQRRFETPSCIGLASENEVIRKLV